MAVLRAQGKTGNTGIGIRRRIEWFTIVPDSDPGDITQQNREWRRTGKFDLITRPGETMIHFGFVCVVHLDPGIVVEGELQPVFSLHEVLCYLRRIYCGWLCGVNDLMICCFCFRNDIFPGGRGTLWERQG